MYLLDMNIFVEEVNDDLVAGAADEPKGRLSPRHVRADQPTAMDLADIATRAGNVQFPQGGRRFLNMADSSLAAHAAAYGFTVAMHLESVRRIRASGSSSSTRAGPRRSSPHDRHHASPLFSATGSRCRSID